MKLNQLICLFFISVIILSYSVIAKDDKNKITDGKYNIILKDNKGNDITGYIYLPLPKLEVYGTEYYFGQRGKVWLQLLNSSRNFVNNGVCYIDIYTPDNLEFLERATMNNMNHDGIYYYDFIVPQIDGVFPVLALCYYEAIQDKRTASSYILNTGVLESGTISDTWSLNLIYLKLKTENVNGGRINASFNFTDFNSKCGNVSENLMNGITIYWKGEWNTNTINHNIVLSIFNYTSNSWKNLTNVIIGGNGGTDFEVTNSLLTNNISKLIGVTSTKPLLINFENTINTEKDKKFWIDYLYVSCDQLSNPIWTEVKGNAEIHISNISFLSVNNSYFYNSSYNYSYNFSYNNSYYYNYTQSINLSCGQNISVNITTNGTNISGIENKINDIWGDWKMIAYILLLLLNLGLTIFWSRLDFVWVFFNSILSMILVVLFWTNLTIISYLCVLLVIYNMMNMFKAHGEM